MYQGKISRRWLPLVLVLFCLPLFVGLRGEDIREDEAIYSFAVDLMLETGDWLQPRSIPNEEAPFLEKPPLKFWIVAAPIKLGLLPHDEFGLRFWDALFGAVSFIYVFLIGCWLFGPVCGLISVLILFSHEPLLFIHGLRGNNMDAPLVLAYCGGMYHFMAWTRTKTGAAHALAVGLYFVLGFMTKFVAVLFLPLVLGLAILLVPSYRRKVLGQWYMWAGVAGIVVLLVAPWFLWAWRRHGELLWMQIFGEAVVTRMTAYLDPLHVQPWNFYAVTMYRWFNGAGSFWLIVAGTIVLGIQAVKRRWPEAFLLLLWGVVPLVLISFGNSKLYHYTYPFLPPLALAAGYLAALVIAVAPAPLDRFLRARPSTGVFGSRWLRVLFAAVAIVALAIAIVTVAMGPILIASGSREIFKSSGILRPLVVAVFFGLLGGMGWRSPRTVVAMLVLSMLPAPNYRQCLVLLRAGHHPMRIARDCIRQVQSTAAVAPGIYVDVPAPRMPYPYVYYFRSIRPWTRAEEPAPDKLAPYLTATPDERPVLVWRPTYVQFQRMTDAGVHAPFPPGITFLDVDDVVLVLPGPYAACRAAVAAHLAG